MPATREQTAPRAGSTFVDPVALMRIRSLELRARTVVEGFHRGLHRSPYHGFSSEFAEYRSYVPGDDPRHIDWKLLARSDRACTRKFEEETNVACHLVLDVSQSMHYGSPFSKLEYARTLAASLAVFMDEQGDAVGLVTFGEALGDYIPARRRHRTRHEIFAALERARGGRTTALDVPLEHLLRTQRRRGMVLLISDLLSPLETLEAKIAALTACGHDVSIFQILDRTELDFSFQDAALFEDIESDLRRHIDPVAMRATYLERLQQHQDRVRALCANAGALHHLFPTDEHLEKALFGHLHDRAARRRGVRRARSLD
jgi:uncharacterized protein (DUF58 family)